METQPCWICRLFGPGVIAEAIKVNMTTTSIDVINMSEIAPRETWWTKGSGDSVLLSEMV
eukprot:m.147053 g.147053  ORF g.147053 m.147053 type:complete len:60 (-) comp11656_c0_seq2:115-294(-)